jgi:hypothetical protein
VLLEDNRSIPKLSELYSKIKDIGKKESTWLYFLNNVTLLEDPTTDYDDQGIPYITRAVIGDGTGQIELLEQSPEEYLPQLKKGDKIKVMGANTLESKSDERTLMLESFGSITKI